MKALGVTGAEIDIRPAARQMLTGHRARFGVRRALYDVTYENIQAGLRTDYLFRLANHNGGLVVGTGDLSELGLGWCTYGVGDQMSHYNPNASVSKTLIQHLIRFVAASGDVDEETAQVFHDILATEISPELVPPGADGLIQSTESIVGPYALQDFNLFYTTRFGFRPVEDRLSFLERLERPGPRALAAEYPGSRQARLHLCPRSSNGCACSSTDFFSSANSSARHCPTARRSPRADRCRRAAIGALHPTLPRRFGSKSSKRAFRTSE